MYHCQLEQESQPETISLCEFLTILMTIVVGVAISGAILLIMIRVNIICWIIVDSLVDYGWWTREQSRH